MRLFNVLYVFIFLAIISPQFVYPQLIDNREIPPDLLRVKPPFEATDRSQISSKDEKIFIVLDNADEISVKDFSDAKTTEAILIGNVRIRFDGSYLRAEKVVITMKDSYVVNVGAYGNIEFTLNGTKYLVESLNYQPDMERGVMYNVRSILGADIIGGSDGKPWFYRAEKVVIQASKRFVIENVLLSTSDTRFEHFALKVRKLWYLQDKVAVMAGMEYFTGQASFLWLPVFLQIESKSLLNTVFGNERRIGYYLINNIELETKIGDFKFGFDFYERQGQYVQMSYKAPPTGMLERFEIDTQLANDIRIVRQGNLISQWVAPPNNLANDLERISQFAWAYKINAAFRTNNFSFEFSIEDKNDPFFLSKYSYRTRFDDVKAINFLDLVSPQQHSWFGYQGDLSPSTDSLNQRFGITMDKFSMTGSWEFIRITRPSEKAGNSFLNNFYDYQLRSVVLPEMSYRFGSKELVEYTHKTPSLVTVYRSDGKSEKMHITKLQQYEEKLANITNISITRQITLLDTGVIQTNFQTNKETISVTNVSTNDYTWVDLSVNVDGDIRFRSQRTYGTNTVTSLGNNSDNTNWLVIADLNQHEEKASLNFDTAFFDNLWSVNNGLNFTYRELWSSFAADFTNNQIDSGLRIDYTVATRVNPKKEWNPDEWYRSLISFSTTIDYTYPLYYLLRMESTSIRESQFSWKNSFLFEWLQWQRETILGFETAIDWSLRYRVPTDEQIIPTDDIYFNNKIYDRVRLSAKTRVFWFRIGTETTLDMLETRTNNRETSFRPITGTSFTNKFVGGYPRLLFEFSPNSKYHYIPQLTYRYNLFEQSQNIQLTNNAGSIIPTVLRRDKSVDMELLWDLRFRNYHIPALYPFIYELTELGFVFQYFHDFMNLRNSYIRVDFVLGFKLTKYLTLRFSSQMLNKDMYLYFGETYNGQQVLAPGEQSKDFFNDLADGLKIWDTDALKRSSFKLQRLNFELIHDLDSWDMRLIFNLGRRVDDASQVAFWEPYIAFAFTLKGSNAPTIFPEFQQRFIPVEFQ